jgi:DNA-binding NtrC family response regulator
MSNLNKIISWIDDDYHVIWAVFRPLKEMGVKIYGYTTYADAMDNIESIVASDLVVVDLILASGDESLEHIKYLGVDLIKKLRGDFDYDRPIITLSVVGNQKSGGVGDELRRLNSSVLTKPVMQKNLVDLVLANLDKGK